MELTSCVQGIQGAFPWSSTATTRLFDSRNSQDIATPILYGHCSISSIPSLQKFTALLLASDKRWDSIRRIPYSTPGRWVQSLDLSQLVFANNAEVCLVDAVLTTLFPLLPFLSRLELTLGMQLSRRAMNSLGSRDGASNLRSLKGIKYDSCATVPGSRHTSRGEDDSLTDLIAACQGLEELEIIGLGLDDLDVMIAANAEHISTLPNLMSLASSHRAVHLPHLHTLTLLSTPSSDLLLRLVHSDLPALRNVVITPYGDIAPPLSLVGLFLSVHGHNIRTLVFHTPKSWPTVVYPPPTALLRTLPRLSALSLEMTPLTLDPPLSFASAHPLETLWIPRPSPTLLDGLKRLLPHLPYLKEVRTREVRWAKRGLSARALEAGFQGEMRTWRQALATRKIRLYDADGREG